MTFKADYMIGKNSLANEHFVVTVKADWRDIEIWKAIREREKAEQEPKKSDYKPEEYYVSKRYR
ncbi:hypothetical protein ANCDUO_00611 [Ancylostoma duodenale]|uniref:Uncharacterized protein n=1 Tax=Ancylostoma duodenale TaxID=51022 RepID=A0A0C2DGE4_9BILA|nr:hypothetical protein ANCDUO_00611 [Ancylostoma duodenale]